MQTIVKNGRYQSYLKKLDEKLKMEEARENYEYCAYILSFKNILLQYIEKNCITPADIRRFNLYLNAIEYKN